MSASMTTEPNTTDWLTRSGRAPWLALAVLAVVGLAAYFNSFRGTMVLDDSLYLNPLELRNPFRSILGEGRPVVAFSLSVNYWLDGMNLRGYHLTNLAIHILSGFLLYLLVRRPLLTSRYASSADVIALFAAIVWLVHPMQTQSVTYLIQRCESLMGLFFLLTLYCLTRGADATSRRSQLWWYAGAILATTLGAGSKEVIVTVWPIALLYDRTFLAGSWGKVIRERWKFYLLLGVPVAALTAFFLLRGVLTSASSVGFEVANFTPKTYALTQFEVIPHYLRLAFWPNRLCLDYFDWTPVTDPSQVIPGIVLIGSLLLISLAGALRGTWWGFLGTSFFLILAPTSTIIPVQDVAFEHRMYLPLACVVILGVALIAGLFQIAITAWPSRANRLQSLGRLIACVVIIALGMTTILRNEDYSSLIKMNQDVIAKRPGNHRGHGNLAMVWNMAGNGEQAVAESEAALALKPNDALYTMIYGASLLGAGRPNEAVVQFRRVEQIDPRTRGFEMRPFALGTTYAILGKIPEAVTQLQQAIEVQPGDDRARIVLASCLMQLGRTGEADQLLQTVQQRNPDLGTQLARWARSQSFQKDPNSTQRKLALLYIHAASRMLGDADPERLDTLALVQSMNGQFTEAAMTASRAAELAAKAGNSDLAARIRARQQLYLTKKRYLPENLG